jgi:hypothetical protein
VKTLHKLEDAAQFNFRYLGRVQAKGKYHPIGIFECIDGDAEKQRTLKLKTIDQFKTAMKAYHDKDFNTAYPILKRFTRKIQVTVPRSDLSIRCTTSLKTECLKIGTVLK